MNLMDIAQLLGNFGEFFGSVAVVVTLAYLAVQIRQNATQVRLSSVQASWERWTAIISNVLDDPAKFEMWRDGLDNYSSLAPAQQAQFHSQMMRGLTAYNIILEMFEAGAIPEELLLNLRHDLAAVLQCAGTKQWRDSLNFEPHIQSQFFETLEAIVADTDAAPLNRAMPFFHKSGHR